MMTQPSDLTTLQQALTQWPASRRLEWIPS